MDKMCLLAQARIVGQIWLGEKLVHVKGRSLQVWWWVVDVLVEAQIQVSYQAREAKTHWDTDCGIQAGSGGLRTVIVCGQSGRLTKLDPVEGGRTFGCVTYSTKGTCRCCHIIVSYFHHIDQLRVSMLTAICFKKKDL